MFGNGNVIKKCTRTQLLAMYLYSYSSITNAVILVHVPMKMYSGPGLMGCGNFEEYC